MYFYFGFELRWIEGFECVGDSGICYNIVNLKI